MKVKMSVSINKVLWDFIESYKKDFNCSTSKAVEDLLTISMSSVPNKKQSFGRAFKELMVQFDNVKGLYEQIEKKKYEKGIPQ